MCMTQVINYNKFEIYYLDDKVNRHFYIILRGEVVNLVKKSQENF